MPFNSCIEQPGGWNTESSVLTVTATDLLVASLKLRQKTSTLAPGDAYLCTRALISFHVYLLVAFLVKPILCSVPKKWLRWQVRLLTSQQKWCPIIKQLY